LIDVGVSLLDRESIDMGKKLDVFLRDVNRPQEYYIGEVWPGKVHFVDYLHPNAS
jgi:alpha-glucosidase (family GH31 glycosyl hydrolase)